MSKRAEERAMKAYPVIGDDASSRDANYINRDRYMEGYSQAEKDCRMTRKDVEKIVSIYRETKKNPFLSYEDIILNTLWDFKDWKNNQ